MDNPGAFSLGDFAIGAAGTLPPAQIVGLDGMVSLGLQARFAYGASSTPVQGQPAPLVEAWIQTSLDKGQSWFDVACFAFAAAGGVLVANVVAGVAVPPTAPQNLGLADGTSFNGLLGDRLQSIVKVTGSYSNQTLLSLWGVAR